MIAVGLSISLLVFSTNKHYGVLAIVMLISFTAQHHIVARRDAARSRSTTKRNPVGDQRATPPPRPGY